MMTTTWRCTALLLIAILINAGCADDDRDGGPGDVTSNEDVALAPAVAPTEGDLLIEEFYYSGASPAGGAEHYFSDQFIELVNVSDQPLDLSGVMIGDVYGAAGEINPGTEPDSFALSRPDEVVLCSVWRLPEGARIEPGERLIIAHDGTNHRPFSTIDLSGADYESFVDGSGRDADHPTVANMEPVVFNGGFDWLMTVFGPSVVILEAGTPLGSTPGPFGELAVAPTGAVLDAVEALMDDASGDFKRLPASVDQGFAWVPGTYVAQSLHRRRSGEGWQDTNDSSADFVAGDPDPGVAPISGGIHGDPWVTLGTGAVAYAPLMDGDDIALVEGGQGGWHLDVSLRFGGFDPDGVLLVYEAVNAQAESISFTTETLLRERAVLREDDGWTRVGDRVVLDIATSSEVVGQEVVLRVTAALDGQTWSDERRVVITDAP